MNPIYKLWLFGLSAGIIVGAVTRVVGTCFAVLVRIAKQLM